MQKKERTQKSRIEGQDKNDRLCCYVKAENECMCCFVLFHWPFQRNERNPNKEAMTGTLVKRVMKSLCAAHGMRSSSSLAKVKVGTDILCIAPNVSLQRARTWDQSVASNFLTTPLVDIFKDKKVVIFGIPGAFTGVCSEKHVPTYMDNADKFKAKRVDFVICVAINDPYTMNEWAEKLQGKDTMVSICSRWSD